MSFDTRDKRASLFGRGLNFMVINPLPSGVNTAQRRIHLAGLIIFTIIAPPVGGRKVMIKRV